MTRKSKSREPKVDLDRLIKSWYRHPETHRVYREYDLRGDRVVRSFHSSSLMCKNIESHRRHLFWGCRKCPVRNWKDQQVQIKREAMEKFDNGMIREAVLTQLGTTDVSVKVGIIDGKFEGSVSDCLEFEKKAAEAANGRVKVEILDMDFNNMTVRVGLADHARDDELFQGLPTDEWKPVSVDSEMGFEGGVN